MNTNYKLSLGAVFLMLLCLATSLQAQNESVTIKESVEDSSDYQFQSKYNYLNSNLMEEKSLFKIGCNYILLCNDNNLPFYNWIPAVSIGYEKKIGNSFSLLSQVRYYEALDTTFTTGFNLKGKYYIDKKKDISNHVSANNFWGRYVLFGLTDIISYKSPDKKYSSKEHDAFKLSPNIQLGIGHQYTGVHGMYASLEVYEEYSFEDGFDCRIEGNISFIIRGRKNRDHAKMHK